MSTEAIVQILATLLVGGGVASLRTLIRKELRVELRPLMRRVTRLESFHLHQLGDDDLADAQADDDRDAAE
ncbi:MAG: hypothetical protein V3V08_23135 [Nannocystaceae bacterium]